MDVTVPVFDSAPRDLGDGLVLRWSRPNDVDPLADLAGDVFREREGDPPSPDTANYTRALMSGSHPLITPRDFAVVEDTAGGRLVACACLLTQTWEYSGVPFTVGRPELVATRLPYRRRGLIRAIFGALHARSAERGDLVQAITGINYFYRQFGYEYALELGGGRTVRFADIPAAMPDHPDLIRLRLATPEDAPLLAAWYQRSQEGSLVSAVVSPDYWRAKLSAEWTSDANWQVRIIEDGAGTALGSLHLPPYRFDPTITVRQLLLAPGVGMASLALPVLRAVQALAPSIQTFTPLGPVTSVTFVLGSHHPWYEALGHTLAPRRRRPYAWYVRVPSLPRFLLRLKPVLEERLAGSVHAGYSGEVRCTFYRGGLRLVFERGALTLAEDWQPPDFWEGPRASFPPLVMLQLIFGYRDLDELRATFPDVNCHEDLESLLTALFPRRYSHVLPLD